MRTVLPLIVLLVVTVLVCFVLPQVLKALGDLRKVKQKKAGNCCPACEGTDFFEAQTSNAHTVLCRNCGREWRVGESRLHILPDRSPEEKRELYGTAATDDFYARWLAEEELNPFRRQRIGDKDS